MKLLFKNVKLANVYSSLFLNFRLLDQENCVSVWQAEAGKFAAILCFAQIRMSKYHTIFKVLKGWHCCHYTNERKMGLTGALFMIFFIMNRNYF